MLKFKIVIMRIFNLFLSLNIFIGTIISCSNINSNATKNGDKDDNDYITTSSGLKYKIVKKGDGKQAQAGNIVVVHYIGKLENGSVFDNSYDRGQPIRFKLGVGRVIKGWDEGIALLHKGDKAKFIIPPELGYGNRKVGSIPPNSTLYFDVELLDIVPAPKAFDVEGKDTIKTKSGLKYIMVKSNPNGKQAQAGNMVLVHYTGYLSNGKIFDSSVERGKPFSFPLGQGRVIKGWDEGIAYLKEGEKARFIIPSNLAYGEKGAPPLIPPNSTLIFDVEIIKVQ